MIKSGSQSEMTLEDLLKNILEHYGEGEENKASRDLAFEKVAKYYFAHCVYINGEPIFQKVWGRSDYSWPAVLRRKRNIDLAAKDADGNLWTARVINSASSDDPGFQEAVRNFVLESRESDIKPDCQTLVLFNCSVSKKDEKKIRKNRIRTLTDKMMEEFDIDWSECQWI